MPMKSKREMALAQVESLAGKALTWAQRFESATRDLARLRDGAGAALLEDESDQRGDDLARKIADTKAQVELASAALDEARTREAEARRRVLVEEAADLDKPIAKAKAALEAHDAKRDELLSALEAFTGVWYEPTDIGHLVEQRGGSVEHPVPTREVLEESLDHLERRRMILLAVADGRDPREVIRPDDHGEGFLTPDELPASVFGPDAVLPAPGWHWSPFDGTDTATDSQPTVASEPEPVSGS